MTYQYTWKIVELTTKTNSNNLQNVVTKCVWSVCGSYVEQSNEMNRLSWVHHISGNEALPDPQISSFVPYDQLTEEQVLQWLWNGLVDKNSIEEELKEKLNQSRLGNVNSQVLPWAEQSA